LNTDCIEIENDLRYEQKGGKIVNFCDVKYQYTSPRRRPLSVTQIHQGLTKFLLLYLSACSRVVLMKYEILCSSNQAISQHPGEDIHRDSSMTTFVLSYGALKMYVFTN
jgi:hypothetical protein